MKNIVIKFSIFISCFLVSISGEAETVHEGPGPYNQWLNRDGIVTRFHIDGEYMGVITNWFGTSAAWFSGSTFLGYQYDNEIVYMYSDGVILKRNDNGKWEKDYTVWRMFSNLWGLSPQFSGDYNGLDTSDKAFIGYKASGSDEILHPYDRPSNEVSDVYAAWKWKPFWSNPYGESTFNIAAREEDPDFDYDCKVVPDRNIEDDSWDPVICYSSDEPTISAIFYVYFPSWNEWVGSGSDAVLVERHPKDSVECEVTLAVWSIAYLGNPYEGPTSIPPGKEWYKKYRKTVRANFSSRSKWGFVRIKVDFPLGQTLPTGNYQYWMEVNSSRNEAEYTYSDNHYADYFIVSDEGRNLPKLGELKLNGTNVLPDYVATTSLTNFLVAGDRIRAEIPIIGFDKTKYELEEAYLIGTPNGGSAKHEHRYRSERCTNNQIIFDTTLTAASGYHGEYTWKVKAIFSDNIDKRSQSVSSNPTNAPVFFKKYGEDQTGIPNWFTYWGQDGACPTLKKFSDQGLITKDMDGNYYGGYSPDTDFIKNSYPAGNWTGLISLQLDANLQTERNNIHFGASACHYNRELVFTNKEYEDLIVKTGGLQIYGIYTLEEVLAHENQHRATSCLYDICHKMGYKDSDYDPTDFEDFEWNWSSVSFKPSYRYNLFYCDNLSDWVEKDIYGEYKLNIKDTDSFDVAKVKMRDYRVYGDDELIAMIAANKVTQSGSAKKENDWAFPGEQTCVPESVMKEREKFGKSYGWYVRPTSQARRVGNYSTRMVSPEARQNQTAPFTADGTRPSITGKSIVQQIAYDETTSLATSVIFKFDFEVKGFKELRLIGVLTDMNSNIVAYANSTVFNENGNVLAELCFDCANIYESGKEGPFKLESVKLGAYEQYEYIELGTLSGFKDGVVELNRKDLARNDAYLLNVVSETVSTNGIEVAINTEVNAAGGYEIFATLGSTNGMPVAMCRKAMDCSVGTNCFKVVFAASDILKSGVDGPYNIDNLALFKDGVRIDSRLDYSILRKNYRADAFDFEDGEEIDSDQFMSQFGDYTPPPELPPVKTYWVVFNANGGTTSETIREVKSGDEIGALPVAESGNDEFLGWYTELEGGTKISESTVVTTNALLHARWQEIPDEVAFTASRVNTQEGEAVVISIAGGNEDFTSSVQLYGVYNTAAAADIDLAMTLVDGKPVKGFKFPYTLSWAAGEYTNRTVTLFTKADKAVEGDEFLTLQLANPVGINIGENDICTVTIEDTNTYATLQDGIMNPNIKVSTKGDGKWIVGEGSKSDESGVLGMYHAESPSLAQGKSSTLSFATVKGNGKFNFYVRFVGDPNEMIPSELSVYNGKKLIGTIDHTQVTNVWEGYTIMVSGGSASAPNTYNFVFTQGSDLNTHVEISDISWDNGSVTPVYNVIAWEDGTEGGYVSGSGPYLKGQTAKLIAKPLPGWAFDGWYEVTLNEENDDLEYALFGEKATVSFKPTRDIFLMAFFKKIPYIRGLADPADGGKVTGSGLCASGKKVTLKAAANKGYVFTGWLKSQIALDGDRLVTNAVEYIATTPSLVIDRTTKPAKDTATSTTLTNVNDNATFYAAFITTDEDKAAVGLTLNGGEVPQVEDNAPSLVTNIMCGVALNWPLASSALSQTTVKIAGLPAGLKFTAKDIMKKGSKTEVEIPANTIYGAPTAASKIDKKTGLPVPSAVKVTVTTAGKSSVTYLMKITVDALPAWAVGNFEGFVSLNENNGGLATMSVAAAGKISGKISYGGTNWTFKADSFAIASETVGYTNLAIRTVATSGKATLDLSLNMVDFLVDSLPSSTTSFAEGYFGEVYTMMYRLPWMDKGDTSAASLIASYAGAYSCRVPYGADSGDVTFVLDEKGVVKGVVILPDGAKTRKATFSCNVLPNYDSLSVVIALPPDAKKGYPAVFKVVNLINYSGKGADNLAFRDPGVVAAVAELTAESGATGTVSVNPKYGQVAPGKDVTLTAKAAKGSVFHRWEIMGVDTEGIDLSSSTLKIKMTDAGDVFAKAVFVTAEEDAASIALSVDALGGEISPEAIISVTNTCGVALKWSVAVDALSKPVVAVTGLPSGLKFTAKDIMKKGSKTEVEIPANTIYGAPTAESKLDAKTGLRKPSVVKFTVTTAGKSKRVYSVDMTVLPLPDWAVGTFNGGGDYGQVSLTVAKTGKLSGKYLSDGLTWSLAADSFDSIDESGDVYRATLIGKSGKLVMTNEIGVAGNAIGGYAESVDYIAYQNNWKLEPWKTVGKPFAKAAALEYEDSASVAGVEAPGVFSLKFAASGAVTVKGSFVTGINEKTGKEILYSASGTAVLAPQIELDEIGAFDAVVFVYLPPKAGKFDGYVRCIGVRWTGEGWIKQ